MRYFLIFFLVLVGFTGITFAQSTENKEDISGILAATTSNTMYHVPYIITSGTVNEITPFCNSESVVVQFTSVETGRLTLDIPRNLLDPKYKDIDDEFFVLFDGEEIEFDETSNKHSRTVTINFEPGSHELEIARTWILTLESEGSACKAIHEPPHSYILPPLKQMRNNIHPQDVICEPNLVKMQKPSLVSTAACVKHSSVEKLIERDWVAKPIQINVHRMPETVYIGPTDISSANNQFAFGFYSQIAQDNEKDNIFFSPTSMSTAFAIAYEGARDDTARQIQTTFGFEKDNDKRRSAFESMHDDFNKKDKEYSLSIANALWIKQDYQIRQEFADIAKRHYASEAFNVDFASDSAVNTINDWIEQKTNNKIQDLFGDGSTDELTRLVITNAIYFDGKWKHPFSPNWTREADFHIDSDNTTRIQMMELDDRMLSHTKNELLEIIELPYKGADISMLILLPNKIDGIKDLEETLTLENLDSWKGDMSDVQIAVYLPKFDAETKYDLKKHLKRMGMTVPFDEKNANFAGIHETEQLYVEEAVHKAFVRVHELGTEAAAATGIEARTLSGPPATFNADHPFVFLIQDNKTGQILFMGKVTDPTA